MSEHSNEYHDMLPMSGESVETDGIYRNEWGGETPLKRGDVFPADPQLGTTTWEMVEMDFDNHHQGRTDQRLIPEKQVSNLEAHLQHPRRHPDDQDHQH